MKSTSRTNNASSQGMAPGAALLLTFAVSLLTSGFVLSTNANERKTAIITFDVPGAGTGAGPGQGTFTAGINAAGTVTGAYIDASNLYHGFVCAANGVITTFDVPGAGAGPGQGTIPASFNPAGAIVGYYLDASYVFHGFLVGGE